MDYNEMIFKPKKDGNIPDPWKVTIMQGVYKNADGKWAPNYLEAVGGITTAKTPYFVLSMSGCTITTTIGDDTLRFGTASDTTSDTIFENDQREVFERLRKALELGEGKGWELAGRERKEVINGKTTDKTVRDAHMLLEGVLGNSRTRVVPQYYMMVRNPITGLIERAMEWDKDPKSGKWVPSNRPRIMESLQFFVHVSEDEETVYKREYNRRVKPNLVVGAIGNKDTIKTNAIGEPVHDEEQPTETGSKKFTLPGAKATGTEGPK